MKRIIQLLSILFPSRFRIFILNRMGHSISRKAKLGWFSILLAKHIDIYEECKIDSFAIITGLDTLSLEQGSAISRFTYISGGKSLILGRRSLIGSRCIVNTGSGDVVFGEYSVLAPRSTIYTHGTFLPVTHGYGAKNKGVIIGNYTWIMQNASIGPGVKIGSNSIVLPGSTIVKGIKDNTVVFDTPIERKTYPIELFKKDLSNEELEELIRSITQSFLSSLLLQKSIVSFNEEESVFTVKSNSKEIRIHICAPPKSVVENIINGDDCYFWYNIDNDLMRYSNVFILDFHKIVSSYAEHPVELSGYKGFMFYEFGLKFIKYS